MRTFFGQPASAARRTSGHILLVKTMPLRTVRAMLVALLWIPGAAAHGQVAEALTGGQCAAVVADAFDDVVHGVLEPESRDATLPRATLVKLLDKLSAALIGDTLTLAPVAQLNEIVVSAIGRGRDSRPTMMPRWAGHPALVTEIAVTLNRVGALVDPEIVLAGDNAVVSVLRRGIVAVPPDPEAAPDRPQRLRLRLTLTPDSTTASAPLIVARQLRVGGTPPRQIPGFGAPLVPSGSRRRMEATVLVWFVVDAKGSAIPASIVAAPPADPSDSRHYQLFVDAVIRAVPLMRYEPAIAGGCATARLSGLSIRFSPSRSDQRPR